MRKLKFHEKKLLRKVNFLEWKREGIRVCVEQCRSWILQKKTLAKWIKLSSSGRLMEFIIIAIPWIEMKMFGFVITHVKQTSLIKMTCEILTVALIVNRLTYG
ncbi:Alpha-L RNA-binding motif/Ribosomal protein S4 family protein [Perilla frutescens var. frutescens]|nr:Alpha-L RNA-binding motif/Ribosomal protein S4 family protein [Perilla frutescens var. frutescens]